MDIEEIRAIVKELNDNFLLSENNDDVKIWYIQWVLDFAKKILKINN